MSIQLYKKDVGEDGDPLTGNDSNAIVVLPNGTQITVEEHEKRVKDAEILEEKLKFITEKIPSRLTNVCGSNAGAGSGEFHMYRMARRREQMRWQRLEELEKEEKAREEVQARKDKHDEADRLRTEKKRAKRLKSKMKKGKTKDVADGVQDENPNAELDLSKITNRQSSPQPPANDLD